MVRKALKAREGGYLIAVIGDEDTATGFLLAGVGENHVTNGANYFVVDPSTSSVTLTSHHWTHLAPLSPHSLPSC